MRTPTTAVLLAMLLAAGCSDGPTLGSSPRDGVGTAEEPAAEAYGVEVVAESGLSVRDGISVNYMQDAAAGPDGSLYVEWYEEDTYVARKAPDGTWDRKWSGPGRALVSVDDAGRVFTGSSSGIRIHDGGRTTDVAPHAASAHHVDPVTGTVYARIGSELRNVVSEETTRLAVPDPESFVFLDPATGQPWSRTAADELVNLSDGRVLDLGPVLQAEWGTRPRLETAVFAADGQSVHLVGWDEDDEMGGEVLVTTVDLDGRPLSTVPLGRPPLSDRETWYAVADDDPAALVVLLGGEAVVVSDGEVVQEIWLCRTTGTPQSNGAVLGRDGHVYVVQHSCGPGLSEVLRLEWGGEPRTSPAVTLRTTGIGPVEFGMTVDEAADALHHTSLEYAGGLCFESAALPQVVLLASGSTVVGAGTFGPLPAAALATEEGVAVGSTAEEVRTAYPTATEEESQVAVGASVVTWEDGEGNAVVANLDQGKTISLFAGQADVVGAVEYCSG